MFPLNFKFLLDSMCSTFGPKVNCVRQVGFWSNNTVRQELDATASQTRFKSQGTDRYLNFRVLRDQICSTVGTKVNCVRQVDFLKKVRSPPCGPILSLFQELDSTASQTRFKSQGADRNFGSTRIGRTVIFI